MCYISPVWSMGRFMAVFWVVLYGFLSLDLSQTLSELVGHASPLKRKIIGCPFLSYSSRGRYWVSVNPARENQPTEPSSGLLESEPNGRKSEASGKSTTVPFGRILAAFDYLNTRVPNCGKIWPNNISYRNPCLRVLHITLLFPH